MSIAFSKPLRKEGVLDLKGHVLRFGDAARLEAMADFDPLYLHQSPQTAEARLRKTATKRSCDGYGPRPAWSGTGELITLMRPTCTEGR